MMKLGTKGKYGKEVGIGEIKEARKDYPKKGERTTSVPRGLDSI